MQHLPRTGNLIITGSIFFFADPLNQDSLLGIRRVVLAPLGIWHTGSWEVSSTLKSSVRAHCLPRSQRPISQPSSWPMCNPLVCLVALGSSWPASTFQPSWEGQRRHCWGLRPAGHGAHVLRLPVAFLSWDILLCFSPVSPACGTREEGRAGQNATINANHWGQRNCVNQSVLIRFSVKEATHMFA